MYPMKIYDIIIVSYFWTTERRQGVMARHHDGRQVTAMYVAVTTDIPCIAPLETTKQQKRTGKMKCLDTRLSPISQVTTPKQQTHAHTLTGSNEAEIVGVERHERNGELPEVEL